METYKGKSIEVTLTDDNTPVFIALIDGVNYNISDADREKCLEKAKTKIDDKLLF